MEDELIFLNSGVGSIRQRVEAMHEQLRVAGERESPRGPSGDKEAV